MIWMTSRRLDWALRARGTHLAAWPEPERDAALGLLRRSRAARQVLADALAADGLPALEQDSAALGRMQRRLRLSLAPAPAVVRGVGWGALAACAAAGLYLGAGAAAANRAPDLAPDLFASVQTMAFATLDQ